jgi:hypothetical protein
MDKDKLREAMIKAMPDSIANDVKEDISNIMLKVMAAVDGESTMGTMIALDILKDMYEHNFTETIKEKFGEDSELHKMAKEAALMSSNTPGTIH